MKRYRPTFWTLGTSLALAAGLAGPAGAGSAAPARPATASAKAAAPAAPAKVALANVKPAASQLPAAKPAATPAPVNAAKPVPARPAPPAAATAKIGEPAKPVATVPGASATPPPLPKGLVLHFGFEQADPKGAIPDLSGMNNRGQATGARWTEKGKLGGGCEFSGPSHCIRIPNSPSLNPKQITLATWFRTARCDGVLRRILEKSCGQGYALSVAGDTPGRPTRGKITFAVGDATPCASDYVITDGTWHHAAATFDGQTAKLYIDAVLQQQVVPFGGRIAETSSDLIAGLDVKNPTPQDPIQCFEGALDEIMIFQRALTAEEIKTMVLGMDPNAGKPLFSKSQVAGRLRQLKLLFEEGLLTDEFYEAKVSECEAAGQ